MLKWAIIGSGDVVNRLVKDSFNTKFSNVKYVYSKDFKQAKKICKKYNYGTPINNLKEIFGYSENQYENKISYNNQILVRKVYFLREAEKKLLFLVAWPLRPLAPPPPSA